MDARQRGLAPKQMLTEDQLVQQVLHYYGQAAFMPGSCASNSYWRQEVDKPGWTRAAAWIRAYADRVNTIIRDVAAGNEPQG